MPRIENGVGRASSENRPSTLSNPFKGLFFFIQDLVIKETNKHNGLRLQNVEMVDFVRNLPPPLFLPSFRTQSTDIN